MAKTQLIEEFHLSMRVPRALGEPECAAIRRTLGSRSFRRLLLRAVQALARRHRSLRQVRITLSR